MRFLLPLIAILLINMAVSGQTIDGLKAKYGNPRSIFEIRPGVIMTVNFGPEREVCEMRLERTVGIDKPVLLNKTFDSALAKEIVDEVAPESERGLTGMSSRTSTRGFWTRTDYFEHVSITYWHTGCEKIGSNLIAITITWRRRRGCEA